MAILSVSSVVYYPPRTISYSHHRVNHPVSSISQNSMDRLGRWLKCRFCLLGGGWSLRPYTSHRLPRDTPLKQDPKGLLLKNLIFWQAVIWKLKTGLWSTYFDGLPLWFLSLSLHKTQLWQSIRWLFQPHLTGLPHWMPHSSRLLIRWNSPTWASLKKEIFLIAPLCEHCFIL